MLIIYKLLLIISLTLLIGSGIYFTFKLSFPQLKLPKLFKGFKNSEYSEISPFKSLMVTLAARIGVGSIAGIALAIYIGGIGTIFWIWTIGIITSINAYCESYLGLKYQVKRENSYVGGPYYYIEKGLKNKKLSIIYAILLIISYIIGFITIQANTITVSITNYFSINKIIVALIITIISLLSIIKGKRRILNISSKIVPIIGISYLLLGLVIIIINLNIIPNILLNIIKSAFNFKSFITGFIPTLLIGIKRGLFITEAGLGTGAIAASSVNTKNKINLSLIQIIGIYFTVFIICTITGLIIITSNYNNLIIENINGIELTQYALNYHLGNIGSIILIIIIFFLAYSTIIAGYYYGENSLNYLFKNNNLSIILKIVTLILIYIGSIIKPIYLWNLVDILILFLVLINTYALIKLRKDIIIDYKNGK